MSRMGEPGQPAWADVRVGSSLPALRVALTAKTLVLMAVATRDFMPYHHNRDYTRSLGIRDVFFNTPYFQGLVGRYVTDWIGPGALIRHMDLSMNAQLCPGDTAEITGTVRVLTLDGPRPTVGLDIRVANQNGPVATSRVMCQLSVDGQFAERLPEVPSVSSDVAGIPEDARDAIGRVERRNGCYPVSEAQIMYWCEMVRDANPLYQDGEHARTSQFGSVIAPPQSLLTWALPRATQMGLDPDHPDVDVPAEPAWPAASTPQPFGYRVRGTSEIIVQGVSCGFGEPLRPGDRVSVASQVLSCSKAKSTAIGTGHFVTFLEETHIVGGGLAGYALMSMFQYTPHV